MNFDSFLPLLPLLVYSVVEYPAGMLKMLDRGGGGMSVILRCWDEVGPDGEVVAKCSSKGFKVSGHSGRSGRNTESTGVDTCSELP